MAPSPDLHASTAFDPHRTPRRRAEAKLAVVLSHPTQYYSPWFRWLAQHTGLDLRVFYLWEFGVTAQRDPKFGRAFKWDVDLLSGYASEFVPNVARRPGTHHFLGLRNPELTARLAAWHPDAVLLFGYKWWSHLRTIFWASRRRVPLLFRGDSHFLGRGRPCWPTCTALRMLYSRFSAFLPVGQANRDYFATLGVVESRLFLAPHSVNDAHFDPSSPETQAETAGLRALLGLGEHTRVVLFAGKLVPEKQPRALLQAFVRAAVPGTALVFVGDGSEKPTLVDDSRAAPAGTVHFLPFANQSEMPARYLLADIFALPSRGLYETWGLAVNEAMHLGVPALVSDRVGCQRDLVTDGKTGWVFHAEDAAALGAALGRALREVQDSNRRRELSSAVRDRIAGYTYRQTTDGLMAALDAVLRPHA